MNKIKFEHLEFTKKEAKKLNLRIWTINYIIRNLKKIQKDNMKRDHSSYCCDAVWRDMQERCILFSNDTKVLVAKDNFDKMIKIYKRGKVNWPGDWNIEEFNPIGVMFLRNQVSEC